MRATEERLAQRLFATRITSQIETLHKFDRWKNDRLQMKLVLTVFFSIRTKTNVAASIRVCGHQRGGAGQG